MWPCSLSEEETEAQKGQGPSPRQRQHSPPLLLLGEGWVSQQWEKEILGQNLRAGCAGVSYKH